MGICAGKQTSASENAHKVAIVKLNDYNRLLSDTPWQLKASAYAGRLQSQAERLHRGKKGQIQRLLLIWATTWDW